MHQQTLVQIGFLIIIVGFIVIFFGSLIGANKENTKFSVFGLVGFIPFGFANDKKLFAVSIAAAIFFLLITALTFLRRH